VRASAEVLDEGTPDERLVLTFTVPRRQVYFKGMRGLSQVTTFIRQETERRVSAWAGSLK
jgi:hypothetical protein